MNKLAMVTGGSRGIGFAIADYLASSGYDLILMAKTEKNMEQAISQLTKRYSQCNVHSYTLDLSQPVENESNIQAILKQHPKIDLLINNAGMLEWGMTELPATNINKLFQINTIGSLVIANAVANQMKQRKAGYIINIASSAGVDSVPKIGVYSSTKAALVSYSSALFKELLHHNVQVTCLCPSVVNTDMTDDGLMDNNDKIQTNDIVKSLDFLLSLGAQSLVERLDIHCKAIDQLTYPDY